jgi:hypothetical protein
MVKWENFGKRSKFAYRRIGRDIFEVKPGVMGHGDGGSILEAPRDGRSKGLDA